MQNNQPVAVITHNPNGKWGDVRPLIQKQGYYQNWNKSINLELGKQVLLYISNNVRQIQYLLEVTRVDNSTMDLKLIKKLTSEQMELLSYKKLKEHGIKQGTINYSLQNDTQLSRYILNVLNNSATNIKKDISLSIKNIILYGSPGVGKTHNTKKLISLIESGISKKKIFDIIKNNEQNNGVDIDNIKDRVKFITFHQSFGYEDFIEGFRPNENGDIKLQDGIFKTICDDADNDREHSYYLVIDEINRGNISKIFGELITLIEEDKRDTFDVILPYSKKPFKIPSNLYITGTMNSTDKSIALIDIALRRRFTFLKMEPNLDLIENDKAKNIMKQLNEKITETLGADYVLGHSYFMKIENDDDLEFVLEYKIKPLLEEYFYGDNEGLKQILEIINE